MIKASTYGKGRTALQNALSKHLPFTTGGALRGDKWDVTNVQPSAGKLNTEERDALVRDCEQFGISYVVWSYATPIAWVKGDGSVYRVQQRFSPTTSKHQGHLYLMG